MRKDGYFTGQPIFTQVLSLIKKSKILRLAKSHQSDKYYKKFKAYDHLVTMLYTIYQRRTSLREVTTGMQASMHKINHLGMTYCPRRSTLAEANAKRNHEVFEAIYNSLYGKYRKNLPDSRMKNSWIERLYIIDSTRTESHTNLNLKENK